MYRISEDLDLKEIVGSEIQQVCSGRYDVQFRFGSGTCIAVQGDITLLNRNKNWEVGPKVTTGRALPFNSF